MYLQSNNHIILSLKTSQLNKNQTGWATSVVFIVKTISSLFEHIKNSNNDTVMKAVALYNTKTATCKLISITKQCNLLV